MGSKRCMGDACNSVSATPTLRYKPEINLYTILAPTLDNDGEARKIIMSTHITLEGCHL